MAVVHLPPDFRQATYRRNSPTEYVEELNFDELKICQEMGWLVEGDWPHKKVQLTKPLASRSSEFREVKEYVQDTCRGQGLYVVDIWRVQNPEVYRSYLRNKENYRELYGKCKVLKLFHGTKKRNVRSIARENLDTRKVGDFGSRYGEGVNFSAISAYASHFCDPGSEDKYLFLCHVLVANIKEVTVGSVQQKPPFLEGDTLGRRYDTTTKNRRKLDVVVKFSEDEFYPTYIIHMIERVGRPEGGMPAYSEGLYSSSRPPLAPYPWTNSTTRVERTGGSSWDGGFRDFIIVLIVVGMWMFLANRKER